MRTSVLTLLAVSLSGCALLPQQVAVENDRPQPTISGTAECAVALSEPAAFNGAQSLGTELRLLNWNIQKNAQAVRHIERVLHTGRADLLLLQEAPAPASIDASGDNNIHWSFAPGYSTPDTDTGVLTASQVLPLTECRLQHQEPWLRSPKATNVTRYALTDTDETLLVINLHVINFTFGVEDMQAQLTDVMQLVDIHSGPVIVSGDLNTWNEQRQAVVADVMQELGLTAVDFDRDVRKRAFGHALDHIYVRGLEIMFGTSHATDSSDHSPMLAVLALAGSPDDETAQLL